MARLTGAPAGRLPGVSVVVPVRNEAGLVGNALRSIGAQAYPGAVETILADGSDGPETARAAKAALPGIRVVANPGRSAAAGMNRGIAVASHGIVARCDARCVLPQCYLARAVATIEASDAANVGGRLRFAGCEPFERAAALAMRTWLGSGGPRWRAGGPPGPVESVPLGVFRRAALAAVGGFDETLGRNEDYEVNLRLRAAGWAVLFDPELAVVYRPRAGAGALARQYFDYGRWKRVVLARHPRSLRARQLAPPTLALALVASAGCAAAALAWPGPAPVLGALAATVPGAWLATLAGAGMATAVRRRDAAALGLAWPLAIMHAAWGAGFLLPGQPRPPGNCAAGAGRRRCGGVRA